MFNKLTHRGEEMLFLKGYF